mmetsp:Transcript_2952/g.10019  ORF Transcript_2952/g.10019 Transcript_2952/m.10019 type:complete len:214 (-) Transcript_2952:284-925(-)
MQSMRRGALRRARRFHVDKMSSAHVYVRLKPGQTIDDISPETLTDCAQLVKANSIQGNKQDDVDVVYTPWDNACGETLNSKPYIRELQLLERPAMRLLKKPTMEVGQVGFKSDKKVLKIRVETRENLVVNRLNKTKREEYPDLQAERHEYEMMMKNEKKKVFKEMEKVRREEEAARKADADARSYDHIFNDAEFHSNKANKGKSVAEVEDDFM